MYPMSLYAIVNDLRRCKSAPVARLPARKSAAAASAQPPSKRYLDERWVNSRAESH